MFKPLDVIELAVAVNSWEAGTVATVLEVSPDSLLAEIADEDGRVLDVLTVPVDAARPAAHADGAFAGVPSPKRPEASPSVPEASRSVS